MKKVKADVRAVLGCGNYQTTVDRTYRETEAARTSITAKIGIRLAADVVHEEVKHDESRSAHTSPS